MNIPTVQQTSGQDNLYRDRQPVLQIGPREAFTLGWSIIPVGRNKRPLFPWKRYQQERPALADLEQWETEFSPPAWAVVTGAISGIVTLDFDGDAGLDTLFRLFGETEHQPHRETCSGGHHIDFIHPGWPVKTYSVKQGKRPWAERYPGLDIRGDGGYAVFCGRNDRGEYRWQRSPEPYPLDMLPEDLRGFLGLLHPPEEPARRPEPLRPAAALPPPADGRPGPELMVRMAVERARAHGRNNSGFELACQLRDNGYSEAEAAATMRAFAAAVPPVNTKGKPEAYTEAEALQSLRQAFSRSPREPWDPPRNSTPPPSPQREPPPAPEPESEPAIAPPPAAEPEPPMNWRATLILNREGNPRALLANAITALRWAPEWAGILHFDEFHLAAVARGRLPWQEVPAETRWDDNCDRLTAEWLQQHGIYVSAELAGQAAETVARERVFHPVREYLDGLTWDGDGRIDAWLSEYLGVEPSEYAAAVGTRWLISAVARIFEPGCKADHCLILEGEQGIRKSMALRTIAGKWFTDEVGDLRTKDAALQLPGVWIVELAELDALSRAEASAVKAFMSRSIDRYRPPYGKRAVDVPRQCVFAGSVNHSRYLKDETGGRRFWPVRCGGGIDVDQLARDRDQLWAEAVARYREGAAWWLDRRELEDAAKAEQAARFDDDPWDELIAPWLERPSVRYREFTSEPFTSDSESVTIADVLTHCLGKRRDTWTQGDKIRVARTLAALGWERYFAGRRGAREWRYRPVSK